MPPSESAEMRRGFICGEGKSHKARPQARHEVRRLGGRSWRPHAAIGSKPATQLLAEQRRAARPETSLLHRLDPQVDLVLAILALQDARRYRQALDDPGDGFLVAA